MARTTRQFSLTDPQRIQSCIRHQRCLWWLTSAWSPLNYLKLSALSTHLDSTRLALWLFGSHRTSWVPRDTSLVADSKNPVHPVAHCLGCTLVGNREILAQRWWLHHCRAYRTDTSSRATSVSRPILLQCLAGQASGPMLILPASDCKSRGKQIDSASRHS